MVGRIESSCATGVIVRKDALANEKRRRLGMAVSSLQTKGRIGSHVKRGQVVMGRKCTRVAVACQ